MAVQIDYLCRHISLDGFDCGNALLNSDIEDWLQNAPDPGELTVLVAHDSDRLRGFVALTELDLRLDARTDARRCFFVVAWAVDRSVQGDDVGKALSMHWRRVQRQRAKERGPYAALAFSSFYEPQLERRYRRQGLRQLTSDTTLWFKLLPDS